MGGGALKPFSDKKQLSVTCDTKAYSSGKVKLSIQEIEERVLLICRGYFNITDDKLTLDSHFIQDLGLDSLDLVEFIMVMEDEFGIAIPDAVAEKLLRPKDIVQYVDDKG